MTPSQIRGIDPFAEYNSNVHNRLTRIISENRDCILNRKSLRAVNSPGYPYTRVHIQDGVVIKDDVMINLTTTSVVDFDNLDNYLVSGSSITETGWYYICLRYKYVKSKPAPVATIVILKPSERGLLTTPGTQEELLFLIAVPVVTGEYPPGTPRNVIDQATPLSQYDPENPDNRRVYANTFAYSDSVLPTFVSRDHTSKIVYVEEEDAYYVGYATKWDKLSNNLYPVTDAPSGTRGRLTYINATGTAALALATSLETRAEMVIFEEGTPGKARYSGFCERVRTDDGTFNVGDVVYLSDTLAGRVSSTKTLPNYQIVGRCVNVVDSNYIDLLFIPGPFVEELDPKITKKYYFELEVGDWAVDGETWYVDKTTEISASNYIEACNFVASVKRLSDGHVLSPYYLRGYSSGAFLVVRVRMAALPTETLILTVVG